MTADASMTARTRAIARECRTLAPDCCDARQRALPQRQGASPGTSRAASWAGDPVFRHLLATGLIPPRVARARHRLRPGPARQPAARVRRHAQRERLAGRLGGRTGWARGCTASTLGERDIQRARAALGASGAASFACADMRDAPFPPSDVVVLLDVLHYVTHEAQQAVLRRACEALSPRGRLLLRVADAGARGSFLLTQWVDRAVARLRGHAGAAARAGRWHDWMAQLRALGMHGAGPAHEPGHAVRQRAAGRAQGG